MTRNQTFIKGFALAALLPLLAACSNDDNGLPQDNEAQPVQINIGTRANYDGTDYTWQENDQIGLNIMNFGSSSPTAYTLIYGANGSWTSTPSPITATLPATVEAWYPLTASASEFSFQHDGEEVQISINSQWLNGTVDQSSNALLTQNDWMTSGQNTISSLSPSLTLQHRLAKVTVNIQSSETVSEVRFFSYSPNVLTGVTDVGPKYLAVNPLKSDNSNTYTAIVSAFYYNGDPGRLPFMKIKVGEKEKLYTLPRNIGTQGKLSAGLAYTFNLTVNTTATRSAGTPECELELVEVRDMNEE